jgi:hypothetical protein
VDGSLAASQTIREEGAERRSGEEHLYGKKYASTREEQVTSRNRPSAEVVNCRLVMLSRITENTVYP